MLSIIKELCRFLFTKDRWWLVPIILFLIVFGALLVLGASSPLAPFIYTLF